MRPAAPVRVVPTAPTVRNALHAERRRDYFRTQNVLIRAETMLHYGNGRCARCHIDDIRLLELDHIHGGNGEGNRDRIARTGACRGGAPFYRALKAAGWPAGFQVLCANCHRIKTLGR